MGYGVIFDLRNIPFKYGKINALRNIAKYGEKICPS